MKHLSPEQLRDLNELANHDPTGALALLRKYEAELGGDPNLLSYKGGLLVDIGRDLQRQELVQEVTAATRSPFVRTSQRVRVHVSRELDAAAQSRRHTQQCVSWPRARIHTRAPESCVQEHSCLEVTE